MEDKTFLGVVKTWGTISGAKKKDASTSFMTRVARQHIMLANAASWNWIKDICVEEVTAIICHNEHGRKAWMRQLIKTVHTYLQVSCFYQIVTYTNSYILDTVHLGNYI